MKCVTYSRFSPRPEKSSDKGDTESNSIEVQQALIAKYCEDAGLTSERDFADTYTSARTEPLRTREAGSQMLDYVRDNGVRHIVVKSLDRIFRNLVDGLNHLREWERKDIYLHMSDGVSFNVSKPTGFLIASNLLTVAEFEPMQTAQRVSDAMLFNQDSGRRMTRKDRIPFGWKLDPRDEDRIVEHPDEQKQIEFLIYMFPDLSNENAAESMAMNNFYYRGHAWTARNVAAVRKRAKRELQYAG